MWFVVIQEEMKFCYWYISEKLYLILDLIKTLLFKSNVAVLLSYTQIISHVVS